MNDWRLEAACRGSDVTGRPLLRWFFTHEFESWQMRDVREATARRICETCPVIGPCHQDAMADTTQVGFQAGMSAAERRLRRRKRAG